MKDIVFTQLSVQELRTLLREEVGKALTEQIDSPTTQKTILNFAEGCEYIGISKSHGYKLTSQELIPFSKRGKRIYFEKKKLDEWLLVHKVNSSYQEEEDVNNYLSKKGGKYERK